MAGRQQVGDGSSSSSFLPDPFLRRRSSETSNEESAGASPSNSIAALVSNYDDLSGPSNPWQYLSTPSSPTSQRDYNYYNAHSNSLHFQRDLVAEYPWMQEVLDQQQRAANSESAGSKAPDFAVDSQRAPDHCNHTTPTRRRREQVINHLSVPDHGGEQAEAFLYEEAVAAWYQNGGYMRPGEGLAQCSDPLDHADVTRNGLARMGWERPSRRELEAGEIDAGGAPAWPLAEAGGTQSGNSPETSLSSETGGGGESDDDDDEGSRFMEPPGSSSMDRGDGDCSTGKRKTPEAFGEDGDDSTRISSEPELKRTPSSGPRKRSASAKVKPREPRYAIKTRTDVDIMDDGFKWRKYGQKAVKNSPHPRNYYRCTTPHCPVRKRVERSHEDAGLVITTYESKHTHLTPGSSSSSSCHRQSGAPENHSPVERPRSVFQSSNSAMRGPFGQQQQAARLPEYSQLAALHQMRALRSLQALALAGSPGLLPATSSLQRDSLLRAQHFLGLHDPASGSFPFPPPGSFLERLQLQQMMRAAAAAAAAARGGPRIPRPVQNTDCDLVRRVLEAEEQDQLQSPDEEDHDPADSSPTFNYGPAAAAAVPVSPSRVPRASLRRSKTAGGSSDNLVSQCRPQQQQIPREPDPLLLNGLLQEMVDQPGDRLLIFKTASQVLTAVTHN